MPKLVVTHEVVDVERWLEGKETIASVSAAFADDITTYVAADGSNNVAFTANVHDMEGLQAFLASRPPEAVANEEKYGVILPQVMYVEK
jgi:hypothetical protein